MRRITIATALLVAAAASVGVWLLDFFSLWLLARAAGLTVDPLVMSVAAAAATGARLMAPFFAARARRGAGAVRMSRLAYEVDLNSAILADVKTLVLCGAQRPTAFFAYPGKPSLPEAPGTAVLELAGDTSRQFAPRPAEVKAAILQRNPVPKCAPAGRFISIRACEMQAEARVYVRDRQVTDVALLIYPVIDMGRHAHSGSRTRLLGAHPTPALEQNRSGCDRMRCTSSCRATASTP